MKQPLPAQSLLFWSLPSFLGLGLFEFPRFLASAAERGGLYPVLGLLLTELAAVWMMIRLAARFPGQTIVEIQRRLFGRTITLIITMVHQLYLVVTLAAVYVIFSNLLTTVVLQRTPVAAVAAALALAALYAAWHGPHALGRGLQLIVPIAVGLLFVAIGLAMSNVRRIQVIPQWPGWRPAFRGAVGASYLLFGVPSLMIFLGWADMKKARPWIYAGWATNALVVVFVYVVVVGTLGVRATSEIIWPSAITIKVISLPGFVIERVGYLVVILWTTVEVAFTAVAGLATTVAIAQATDLRANRFRWLLAFVVLAPISAAFANINPEQVYSLVQRYLVWFGMVALLTIPALTLAVAVLKRASGPPIWTWRTPTDWQEWDLPTGTPPGTLPTGGMKRGTPSSRRVLRRSPRPAGGRLRLK